MSDIPTLVAALEELLVSEFRLCQALHALTSEERQALAGYDLQGLSRLVERKEALLDELGQIDDRRRMVVQELSRLYHLPSPMPSIAEISAALPGEAGRRVHHLREGIVALAQDIRDLSLGNQALALTALQRADALQTFLLDLCRPALLYQPPGSPPRDETETPWGVDQRK
jgi:flagellar biosynthesis/type III secretory pathway chaperone